jgi:hypothetical protein
MDVNRTGTMNISGVEGLNNTVGTAMSRDTDERILSVVLEIVAPSHYLPRRYLTY